MFFFHLFIFSLCEIENYIISLTDKSFERLVLNHPDNEIWFLMFVQSDNDQSNSFNKFKLASEVSSNLIRFATLNVNKYENMKEYADSNSFPCFKIYAGGENVAYNGEIKVRDFMKTLLKYLKNEYQFIRKDWKDDMMAKPSAMMFSNKKKPIALWTAVSHYYKKKPIRIGYTYNKEIIDYYNVTELPCIVFANGTSHEIYQEPHTFKDIKNAINMYFSKKLDNSNQNNEKSSEEINTPDEFTDQCYGGKDICVLVVDSKISDEINSLIHKVSKRKFRWFVGVNDLPCEFMNEMKGAWIYNPRRDGFIHVDESSKLPEMIDRVLDGTVKWQKRSEFNVHNKDEL